MPRGKPLSSDVLYAIKAAYGQAALAQQGADAPRPAGAGVLMGEIPFQVGRSQLTIVSKRFNEGGGAKSHSDTVRDSEENCDGALKGVGARWRVIDIVGKSLKDDGGSGSSSCRKLAAKAGCSKATAKRALQRALKKNPLRKVATTKIHIKTLAARQKAAAEITAAFGNGELGVANVFFPGETRVDTGATHRLNPKNNVVRAGAGEKKKDVMGQLEAG